MSRPEIRSTDRLRLNKYAPAVIHKIAILTVALMWIPLLFMVWFSFSDGTVLSFPPESYSFQWYINLVNDQQARGAVVNSLKIAFVATPITVFVGLLGAIGLDRYDISLKPLILVLIITPLLVPRIVGAISLFQLSEFVQFKGYWLVVMAHVVVSLPFASLVLLETIQSFDRTLESAAKDLGADEISAFVDVTLPNILNGITAAAILVFTFSINEFLFTYFTRDSDMITLPIYLFTKTVYGTSPVIYALSVVFIITATALVLLAISLTSISRVTRT